VKRNLESRLKKVENSLSVTKKKRSIALVRVNSKKSPEEEDLLRRERAGEKIDWEIYQIVDNVELKEAKNDKERAGEEA